MRSLLWITLLLYYSSYGQNPPRTLEKTQLDKSILSDQQYRSGGPTGFWGMDWGLSKTNVISKLREKGYRAQSLDDKILQIEGAQFGGETSEKIHFFFDDFGLSLAIVYYDPDPVNLMPTYDKLKAGLSKKYAAATHDIEEYAYPYSMEDRGRITPITGGYTKIAAVWRFKEGTIGLTLSKSLIVSLIYAKPGALDKLGGGNGSDDF